MSTLLVATVEAVVMVSLLFLVMQCASLWWRGQTWTQITYNVLIGDDDEVAQNSLNSPN